MVRNTSPIGRARRNARRTAIVLGAVALAFFFAAFLWRGA